MAFKKGNKLAKGGPRPGSGRPHDEFKAKCQEIANSPKMFQWLRDIVDGKITVDADVRLKAWDRLMDRGYGKPAQSLDVTNIKSKDEIDAENKRYERLYGYLGAFTK